jgi:hypothetical protein
MITADDGEPFPLSVYFVPLFFTLLFGALLGSCIDSVQYSSDTRYCTILCPGNAESLQFNEDCYCKQPRPEK